MRWCRRTIVAFAALVATVAAGAVVGPTAANAAARPHTVWGSGRPNPAGEAGAYAYDVDLVPAGASVRLMSVSARHRTHTLVALRGLRPDHNYGTHLHANACAADPEAAGPHFQKRQGATTDPRYANPRNEVWLDVRTDGWGAGATWTINPWRYGTRVPRSVVVHAAKTSTDPETPGVAGARVACVTLHAR
jgi:Cu-Zn family superoxide dismutase